MGVPGELAGLWEAHNKFGKVAWADLIRPVRTLAENGVAVSFQLSQSLIKYERVIRADPILRYFYLIFL